MDEWIRQAAERNPVSTQTSGAITVKYALGQAGASSPSSKGLEIKNGWFVYKTDNSVVTGKTQEVPWWSGGVEAKDLEQAKQKLAITRFVPGRIGPGLTDDLNEVVQTMKENNIVALDQHYGLWYDRRRDDHERVRRMDGDVWPPFYELPFARSGKI